MSTPEDTSPELQQAEARLRQLQRERNLLFATLLLVVALAWLDRIGTRVYAIAVWDAQRETFIERVYLPQRAQAEEALSTVLENARKRHPFYKDAPNDFTAGQPSFQERCVIRRVRRLYPLAIGGGGQSPVQQAAESLTNVLHVQVNAVSIYNLERRRPVVVLPSVGMATEAQDTRLENIGRRVSQDLRAPDYLVEKPTFLQKVALKPVVCPVEKVLTVQQAVDYLTHGDTPALHEAQPRDTAQSIAEKYSAKLADLAKWNPGRDLNLVRPGDKLVVRRPEPPLTVLTVERRISRSTEAVDGQQQSFRVTVEIRRHDGEQKARTEIGREKAE